MNTVKTSISALIVLCLLSLVGCAHNSSPKLDEKTPLISDEAWYQRHNFTDQSNELGELKGASMYDLLVAEIAGQQQDFKTALAKYNKQARLTKDPKIIERAIRIAQYTQDVKQLEQLSKLWLTYKPDANLPAEILAGLYLHQKRFSDAQQQLISALQNHSPRVAWLIRHEVDKIPQNIRQTLLSEISTQLKQTPKNTDLWLTRSTLESKLNKSSAALNSLNQVIKHKSSRAVLLQKAQLLAKMKRYSQALSLIKQLLKETPDRRLSILQIKTLYEAKAPGKALAISQDLIKDSAKDKDLHLYLALLALDFNQIKASKNMLESITATSPKDTSAFFYLGLIAEQEEDKATALKHYQNVKHGNNIMPANVRILGLLNSAHEAEQVQLILNNAQQQTPELAPKLIGLHADWLLSRQGKKQAITKLEEGLKLYPDNVDLLYTRALLRPEEEFLKLEAELRFVLQQDPKHASAMNALGYSLTIHSQRFTEAKELLTKAIALKPDDPAIMDSMGWVLFKLGDYLGAQRWLEKAFKLYPDPEVGNHLIQTKLKLGDRSTAMRILQKLLKKHPNDIHLQEAARAINP